MSTDTTAAVQWTGRDTEVDYLITLYPDGCAELATRPIGGARWSPPVSLTPVAATAMEPVEGEVRHG